MAKDRREHVVELITKQLIEVGKTGKTNGIDLSSPTYYWLHNPSDEQFQYFEKLDDESLSLMLKGLFILTDKNQFEPSTTPIFKIFVILNSRITRNSTEIQVENIYRISELLNSNKNSYYRYIPDSRGQLPENLERKYPVTTKLRMAQSQLEEVSREKAKEHARLDEKKSEDRSARVKVARKNESKLKKSRRKKGDQRKIDIQRLEKSDVANRMLEIARSKHSINYYSTAFIPRDVTFTASFSEDDTAKLLNKMKDGRSAKWRDLHKRITRFYFGVGPKKK